MGLTSDTERVLEIDRYHVLLDPPRADLVALVDVAAQVAQVPLATINLITDTEQHQIATAGFDASICAREDSMCNLVLHEKEPVIVPDASQDPRFKDNPFVTGEIGDVRFYATHQLRTPAGVVIGTLCVFDTEPRELGDDQEEALVKLADRVVDLLELELRTRDRQRKLVAKIDSAIRRIDEGEYGYCEVTGEPISLKRLDARPIATMSLEAQERHERREKVHRDD